MTYEQGALVEPATVAIHGLYQTNIKMGYEVAVVGCGNIGLMAIRWAKAFGAKKVFAIDIDDAQLEIARKFGADVLINSTNIDFHDEIRKYGNGVDLAIDQLAIHLRRQECSDCRKRAEKSYTWEFHMQMFRYQDSILKEL